MLEISRLEFDPGSKKPGSFQVYNRSPGLGFVSSFNPLTKLFFPKVVLESALVTFYFARN